MDLLSTDAELEILYSFSPDQNHDREDIEEQLKQFKNYTSDWFRAKAKEVFTTTVDNVILEQQSSKTYSSGELDMMGACAAGHMYCHYLQWMLYFEESERLPCTPWMFSHVQQTAFPAGLADLFVACYQCACDPSSPNADKGITTKALLEYVRPKYSYQKAVPFVTKVLAIESGYSADQTDKTSILGPWQGRVVLITHEMKNMQNMLKASASAEESVPDIYQLLANGVKYDLDELEKMLKRFEQLKYCYNWSFFPVQEIRNGLMQAGVPSAFSMKSAILIYREFLRNEMEGIVWEHWNLVLSSGSLLAKRKFENPIETDEKEKLYKTFCKLIEEGEYDTPFES